MYWENKTALSLLDAGKNELLNNLFCLFSLAASTIVNRMLHVYCSTKRWIAANKTTGYERGNGQQHWTSDNSPAGGQRSGWQADWLLKSRCPLSRDDILRRVPATQSHNKRRQPLPIRFVLATKLVSTKSDQIGRHGTGSLTVCIRYNKGSLTFSEVGKQASK